MAKQEKEQDENVGKESTKKLVADKPSVDFPVDVIATEADPYHETGAKFQAGTKKAAELVKRGWVKMAMIALLMVASIGLSVAQNNIFYNPLGTNLTTDTVTNTGTGYVSTRLLERRPHTSELIVVTVTKISGTVGGTITLQGSQDGTTYKALNTNDTQTALATITATDATNTYHWRLLGGGFNYYRVTWTGTGTMSATIAAKIWRN
jgi:hypothetical protein